MGLYKRPSGVYWISLTIDGKQRWESCKTHNKKTAQKLLAIRTAEAIEKRYQIPTSNPPRLKEWTADFLSTVLKDSTKSRYECSVKQILAFFGDKTRLTDISVSRIEAFKKKRLADGITSAGCNRDLAVLRRLLNLAERQRLIARNPFSQVDMLDERKTRKQPHILTFEEQAKLLTVATPHLRCMIALLVETGLRVNCEAMKLTWKDVDFGEAQIEVRESKTMAGRRVIPLSEFCKAELGRWRKLTGPEFSEFVFPNPSNQAKALLSIRKTWSTALRNAGLAPFPIYSLRATFASRLSAAGVPDGFVSQMLGHEGGLLQTYSKAVDEFQRDAIRKLEKFRETNISCPTSEKLTPPIHPN
jgi:integrase